MPNFVQQVASGKHYDRIKSIGISHPDLKKLSSYHLTTFGSMDKSKFEIGYDQNNQIIPFGEICWKNGGIKYFAIGQINDSDLNLKNTAQSNQMIVDGGMYGRIHNDTPGVKIRISRWSDGNCYITEYRA